MGPLCDILECHNHQYYIGTHDRVLDSKSGEDSVAEFLSESFQSSHCHTKHLDATTNIPEGVAGHGWQRELGKTKAEGREVCKPEDIWEQAQALHFLRPGIKFDPAG